MVRSKITQRRKRRFKRPRQMLPTWQRVLKTKSYVPRRLITLQKGGRLTLYKLRPPRRRFARRFHNPLSYFQPITDFFKLITSRSWSGKTKRSWGYTKKKSWDAKKSSHPARKKTSTYALTKDQWKMEKDRIDKIWKTKLWKDFSESQKKEQKFREQLRTKYARERLGIEEHKKDLRGGWRDMSQRKYKNWGPYPKHLGPALIFDIIPTRKLIDTFKKMKKMNTDVNILQDEIRKGLDDIKMDLYKYAIEMIGRYVPMDTGDLKLSMIHSIKESKRYNYRLKVELKAEVDHAGVVNKKPSSMLQHFGYRRSWRTHGYLYDPKAQHGYFGLITMLLREKARKLIQAFVNHIVTVQFTSTVYTKTKGVTYTAPRLYGPTRRYARSPKGEEDIYAERMAKLRAKHEQDKKRTIATTKTYHFDRHLIKGWFKIKGIDKRRI